MMYLLKFLKFFVFIRTQYFIICSSKHVISQFRMYQVWYTYKFVLEIGGKQFTLKINIYMYAFIQFKEMKTNFILLTSFINNTALKESNLTYPVFTI